MSATAAAGQPTRDAAGPGTMTGAREALVEQLQREIIRAAEALGTVTGCIGLEQQIVSAAATCAPQLADELTGEQPGLGRQAATEVIAALWGPGAPSAEWWETPLGLVCRQALGIR